MDRIKRYLLAGLLTVVPLWITVWVMWFVFEQVVRTGRPLVLALARAVRPTSTEVADLLMQGWFQSLLAVALVTGLLLIIGAATRAVVGRRLLRFLDRLVERVPLAKTIHGATRTLISSLQTGTANGQRVVLIEFPTPEMRAVGFVTATFVASDTGEELAAVYVPTTPNPTSGYVEIVPTKRLVWLDWSANEAMSFIVSGGAMTPKNIRMLPESAPPPPAEAPVPHRSRT